MTVYIIGGKMEELKVGDKIRLLKSRTSSFPLGEVFTVFRLSSYYAYFKNKHGAQANRSLGTEGEIWERVTVVYPLCRKEFDHTRATIGAFDNGEKILHPTTLTVSFINKHTCQHKWTKYEGFTECYDYCIKCDSKRREI